MLTGLPSFEIATAPAAGLIARLAWNPGPSFLAFLSQACCLVPEIPAEPPPIEETSLVPECVLESALDVPIWDLTWQEWPERDFTAASPLTVVTAVIPLQVAYAALPIAVALPGGIRTGLGEGTSPPPPALALEEEAAMSLDLYKAEVTSTKPSPRTVPVPPEPNRPSEVVAPQAPETEGRSLPHGFRPPADTHLVCGLSSAPLAFAMQLRMSPARIAAGTPQPAVECAPLPLPLPRQVARLEPAAPPGAEPPQPVPQPRAGQDVQPGFGSGHGSAQDPPKHPPQWIPAKPQPCLPGGAAPPVPVLAAHTPATLENVQTPRGAPAVHALAEEIVLPPPAVISHIRLRLGEAPQPDGAQLRNGVDVSLMSRGSELRLAVHSSDSVLNQKMRDQIGDLVVSLERAGYQSGTKLEDRQPMPYDRNGSSRQGQHPPPDGFPGRHYPRKKHTGPAWRSQWAASAN